MPFSFDHRKLSRKRRSVYLVLICALFTLLLVAPGDYKLFTSSAAGAPALLAQTGSTRAIALDSITRLAEPFAMQTPVAFGSDARTRITLFATNLTLATGETFNTVTADAQDGSLARYPMSVEYVGAVPGQTWMTAVVVRLNDNLGDVGDVLVGITYHGLTSNRVRVGIGHVGGGPPDDPPASPTPTPSATPELGSGASVTASSFSRQTIRGTRTYQLRLSMQIPTT